ncbi:MAG: biopolymer transporter ExbD [Bacteroidota bacterium]|nr:biopolymer transporter ExbD [Bacteroidota bacterium]
MIRGKFQRRSFKSIPPVSTASLPDIVFMLLFFMMVATNLRQTTQLVKVKLPEASESAKIEDPENISYIYLGPPADSSTYGDAVRLQLNDQLADIKDIGAFVASEFGDMQQKQQEMHIFSLRVDQNTPMQIVTEVKNELRNAGARRIYYSVAETDEK